MKRQSMIISFSTPERISDYQADYWVQKVTELIEQLKGQDDSQDFRVALPLMNQEVE